MSRAPDNKNYSKMRIAARCSQIKEDLKAITGDTADLNIMDITIGETPCAVITIEGMVSSALLAELMFQPLTELEQADDTSPESIFDFLTQRSLMAADRQTVRTYGDMLTLLFSGFAAVVADTQPKAVMYGIQGYEKRAVSLPETEQTIYASHDSFNETLRVNMSLIRRRLKTPSLRFELLQSGRLSKTDIAIAYIDGRVTREMLDDVRKNVSSIKLDTVLNTGYVRPFIDESFDTSVFSAVMTTERPDTVCAYLNEGRIAVIVDGTPFAIIIPTVFADNFRTMDDYCEKTIYVAFSRWMKYISFFLAVVLPGLYAALVTFHPEIFSLKLLLNLAASEEATPYPLAVEMLIVIVLFEIMREAGVRLPKAVGGAVSIVGGLIIGDAAAKSGIISQPLLIVIGVTATASFVLPSLYPAISVLRMIFILAGGLGGLLGIAVASLVLLTNVNTVNDLGVSFTAPLMPFEPRRLKDVLMRGSFKQYEKTHTVISKQARGADVN